MSLLRKRTAEILDTNRAGDRLNRFVAIVLIVIILLNVLAIILESVSAINQRFSYEFKMFEVFSVIVFTLEYLMRIWSCPDLPGKNYTQGIGRLRYMATPMALIDLVAILPFYLMFFVTIDLRFLRVVRLLRIFKLTRYSGAMHILLSVLKEEASAFVAAFSVLIMLLILASSGIYLIEQEIQPHAFGSIPDAMWWAMATLTTVGYGDVTPITPMGKFFGGCITIVGVGMVALPAGILASGFAGQLHRRRQEFEDNLHAVYEDGLLSDEEEQRLEELRSRLGLSQEDTEQLSKVYVRKLMHNLRQCPHCHKPLVKQRSSDGL